MRMKNSKLLRSSGILIIVAVVAACLMLLPAVTRASTEYSVSLTGSDGSDVVTAKPGDTVTLSLNISDNPGILTMGVQLQYPAGMSLAGKPVENAALQQAAGVSPIYMYSENLSENPYLIWMLMPTGTAEEKLVTFNGKLHNVSFKLADDMQPGDYQITLAAPEDKNLNASVDGNDKILYNTNQSLSYRMVLTGCTIRVECPHSYVNGVCSLCHESALTYAVENNQVTITGCDPAVSGKVVIPAKIDGYPVTAIGDSAFSDCTELTGISLPAGITAIGNGAFNDCAELSDVFFAGTQEQWDQISVGQNNAPLTNVQVRFAEDAQPGDIDGDFEITDWDGVLLARYLAGWTVEINNVATLDIDGDGEVTDWDGVLLDRYLAGWNVTIG